MWLLSLVIAGEAPAKAENYPTHPVRFVVGFPSGGTADIQARIMGQWLSERLGQPVIIENKPGAASNLSIQSVINSRPDGYTLVLLSLNNVINSTFFEKLPFEIARDITPVAGIAWGPIVMEVHPSVPARTIAEFIAYAKGNPGKISIASFGVGSMSHLVGELFKTMTGVNMVHVPYRGDAPALADLIAGHVQVYMGPLTASLPHIKQGALRVLGVATSTRLDALPDVPTISETVPGFEASGWAGIGVRAGTPPEIVETINREINAGLAVPAIRARLSDLSAFPMPLTPAQFATFIAAETAKWAKVIEASGVKAE
ncbi:MAG TPA: tripartite tricarboxylate transporter substrate binding protein [Xanthobacteraceae bacterium]|nr:tripartite tricarboxylate transporter substrate binding protein [Xanthobacteraceae bacterium]